MYGERMGYKVGVYVRGLGGLFFKCAHTRARAYICGYTCHSHLSLPTVVQDLRDFCLGSVPVSASSLLLLLLTPAKLPVPPAVSSEILVLLRFISSDRLEL